MSDVTYLDLQTKRHRQPFKPFRIRTEYESVFDILEPWMIVIGETSAVVVTETRTDVRGYKIAMHWTTISIEDVVDLIEIESKRENRKRKRA